MIAVATDCIHSMGNFFIQPPPSFQQAQNYFDSKGGGSFLLNEEIVKHAYGLTIIIYIFPYQIL